jgi:hypothetical protein
MACDDLASTADASGGGMAQERSIVAAAAKRTGRISRRSREVMRGLQV